MQHQKTAVRLEQAAGPDAGEVRHQHIVFRAVFDAAEQWPVKRVVFHDHRGSLGVGVVHHQVDAVARQLGGQQLTALVFVLGRCGFKQLQVVQHIAGHFVQPGPQFAGVLELLFQALTDGLHFAVHQRFDGLPPQGDHALSQGALQRRGGFQESQDFAAKFAFPLVKAVPLGLGQAGHVGGRQRLARFGDQREHQLSTVSTQREVARLGKCRQGRVGLGLLLGVPLFQRVLFVLEIGFGKALGNIGLQGTGELLHELAQFTPLASRQAQGTRPFRRFKMVQVAEIRRHGACRSRRRHFLAQQGGSAGAHIAQHKQVVVGLVHPQTKPGRRVGAFLADPGQGLLRQFGRGGKSQTTRIHPVAQIGRRQTSGKRGHAQPPSGRWERSSAGGRPNRSALAFAQYRR